MAPVQQKKRSARRVYHLEFKCTQDKFTAVPEASGAFGAEVVYDHGDGKDHPAGHEG